MLIPTLRDPPKDAEAASHQLAIRAGLIRQLSSGVYTYLPLGYRSLQKVIGIVREEMNRTGAQEILMPALHPAELWKKTGRYDTLGDDKIAFKNRAGHEFVLGPTHEEVVTELASAYLKSFRDMPQTFYQIQTKFRDEARPRYGVIRTKEFIMKDAYSFDTNEAGLDVNYKNMSEAYHRIFSRCGLTFSVVAADPGMMGGKMSQEFMVVCPYGEDRVAVSKKGDMVSLEIARRAKPALDAGRPQPPAAEPFDTPNLRTIEEISRRFKIKPAQMIKTLIFIADENPVAALVRGDSEVNEIKLRHLIGAREFRQAEAVEVREATGAPVGFAGPIGLKLPLYADWDVMNGSDFVAGANEADKHLRHVDPRRDFKIQVSGDIRFLKSGDPAEDGSGALEVLTTMEIGHVFKLGTRYSSPLDACYLDEKGERKPAIMGCYGIGINRIFAAAIEEHHDDKGIRWPEAIAPFHIEVISLNEKVPAVKAAALELESALTAFGMEVLYDDRDERAGVKFNDADLIGIPVQVIIGERNLSEGNVEVKLRRDGSVQKIPLDRVGAFLRERKAWPQTR